MGNLNVELEMRAAVEALAFLREQAAACRNEPCETAFPGLAPRLMGGSRLSHQEALTVAGNGDLLLALLDSNHTLRVARDTAYLGVDAASPDDAKDAEFCLCVVSVLALLQKAGVLATTRELADGLRLTFAQFRDWSDAAILDYLLQYSFTRECLYEIPAGMTAPDSWAH
jgi:hypothetical protein